MDGIIFFNRELRRIRFPYYSPFPKFAWRLMGFEAWIRTRKASKQASKQERITLSDAFKNLLPGRFRNKLLQHKLESYSKKNLDTILDSSGVYSAGQVSLLGRPFYPGAEKNRIDSWLSAFKTINEVLVCDQYHAKDFIKEKSFVIDAGANIGAFSVFAANLAPKGHVYCFEPTPETFEVLRRNTADYPNITIFNKALGDVEKQAELSINERTYAGNAIIDSEMTVSGKMITVDMTTVDAFIDDFGIAKIDFIKADTEGYEKQIIRGAKSTIQRFSSVLSMSAYHHPKDKTEIPALIRSIDPGYKYKIDMRSEEDLLFWK